MRRALQRIWSLPWPHDIRLFFGRVARLRVFQTLLIPHFHVGVVGLITNPQREILMLHHTYREEYPWGLPTGFLEHGEQPIDAIGREVLEEAGFAVRLDGPWMVYADEPRRILNIVFKGECAGGEFRPSSEIDQAGFFASDNLPEINEDQRHLVQLSEEGGN